MSKYFSFVAAGMVFLSGCTLAPDYERPESPVTGSWPQSQGSAQEQGGEAPLAADLLWQDVYKDARLQQLIALALENNRDLRIAALNVERLRAQYRIARADLMPTLGAQGGWTRQHTPGDLTGTGVGATGNRFDAVGVASYEVDLFGRIRSLSDSALQTFFATEEARKSARLSLVAAVANQYLIERTMHEQLALAEQTLETVTAWFELINNRYELGDATLLDLRTAQSQVESARSSVALYAEQAQLANNGLELLLGTAIPQDLPAAKPLTQTQIMTDLQPGLPSDLLTRRPDILAAEFTLKSANANIGAARAAFFPQIVLTASGGTASAQLSDLFTGGSGVWAFAPTVSVPIFTGGRTRAALDDAKVVKSIEIAQYEQTIQTAFREVSDGLTTREWIGLRIEAHRKLVAAQQERFELAGARYDQGVDSYLAVLTAQQDLFRAQRDLIDVEAVRLANLVTLYKSLGGGWAEPEQTTQDAQEQLDKSNESASSAASTASSASTVAVDTTAAR